MEEIFDVDETFTDESLVVRTKQLQSRCYELFKDAEREAIKERIESERKDFRWHKLPSGKIAPSVSSICSFDKDFDMPPHELSQYASWGTCFHAQITEFWKTKTWKDPKDIEGAYADFVIVKRGSLMLDLSGIDFPAYLKKYPFDCKGYGVRIYNEEFEYAGEIDYWGVPQEDKDWQAVPTMVDAKRTPDKSHFLQIAAYSKGKPYENVLWPDKFQQMMQLPLQNKTQQGFSKPIISTEIDRAFELFLSKRKKFRERFGI